jgi:hypothetical protein
MKIEIDPKTFETKFGRMPKDGELRQEDLEEARQIKKMMMSKGWKILCKYEEFGQQSILDVGMNGIKAEETRGLSDLKWGILKGWTENSKLAERIVARAEEYMNNEGETQDDGQSEDEL